MHYISSNSCKRIEPRERPSVLHLSASAYVISAISYPSAELPLPPTPLKPRHFVPAAQDKQHVRCHPHVVAQHQPPQLLTSKQHGPELRRCVAWAQHRVRSILHVPRGRARTSIKQAQSYTHTRAQISLSCQVSHTRPRPPLSLAHPYTLAPPCIACAPSAPPFWLCTCHGCRSTRVATARMPAAVFRYRRCVHA
jgi:hypothetical protein